jgi:hypothetical protein
MESGWFRYHQKSHWEAWSLCDEAPKRRRRSLISEFTLIFFLLLLGLVFYRQWDHFLSGNNIYGDDVRTNLLRLQKEGSEEDAAYILMQRIFPMVSPTFLVREGICHKDHAISELGVYGAYLRYVTRASKYVTIWFFFY